MPTKVVDQGADSETRIQLWGGLNPTIEIVPPAQRQPGSPASQVTYLLRSLDPTQDRQTLLVDAKTFILALGQRVDVHTLVQRTVFSYDYSTDVLTVARPVTFSSGIVLPGSSAALQVQAASFTETSGTGTYTASVVLPAGSTIIDIKARSAALWVAATAARLDIGDANVQDGWFSNINLKATDLLVGEEINFDNQGGKAGQYLSQVTALRQYGYNAAAYTVIGKVTAQGTGAAGVSQMLVLYTTPTYTAATKV